MNFFADPRYASGPSYGRLTEDAARRMVYEEPGRLRSVMEEITVGYDELDLAELLINAHYALDKVCQGIPVDSMPYEEREAFKELANLAKHFSIARTEAIENYVDILLDEANNS